MAKHGHFTVGTEATPYQRQERDVEIGRWLAKLRFADADQLCRLVSNEAGGSYDRTKVRLTKMRRNHWLVKPKGQKEYWDNCGRRVHIYGNSSKMGRLLQELGEVSEGRLDWTQRNQDAGRKFIEHTVETSELAVTFETSVRRYRDWQVKGTDELFGDLPEATQTVLDPWVFEGKPDGIPGKVKGRVRPDLVLSTQHVGQGIERFFPCEIDTTHMSVVRGQKLENDLKRALLALASASTRGAKEAAERKVEDARFKLLRHNLTIDQSSFLQKFATYYWAYKKGWHKDHFGWPSFQVLVTTRTPSHRDSLIEKLPYVTGGNAPNLFLFSTFDEIRACDDIFRHEWLNGAGEPTAIMAKG